MKPKKSAYAKLASMHDIVEKFCKICGANIFDENYEITGITIVMLSSIILFFVFVGYTISIKFHEDWKVLIEASCVGGSAAQGCAKFLTAYVKRKQFRANRTTVRSIYKYYESVNLQFSEILQCSVATQHSLVLINCIAWLLTGIFTELIPVFFIMFKDKKILVLEYLIPKIDPETDHGYILLYVIHSATLWFGCIGNCVGDIIFLMENQAIVAFYKILQQKIVEFNDLVSKVNVDQKLINEKFRDLAVWLSECTTYLEIQVQTLYYWVLIEVACCAIACIFSTYIIMTGDWPAAYPYFVLSLALVYAYCYTGTMIDNIKDTVIDCIYEIKWYQLSVKQQKGVLFMLMKAQNTSIFSVGDIEPLSVATALKVTKAIYTFAMMLINYSD